MTSQTSSSYLNIDGAMGEGGGQILRTALALSICTGQPFYLSRIRAARKKPGLQQQHLTAVRAATKISGAQVIGDNIGSTELTFIPGDIRHGNYHFAIGTAGSTTLVLQTILYPLLLAKGTSQLTLEGGTHNPLAPPVDFLTHTFLPIINRLGPQVTLTLNRYGFFPRGGGRLTVEIVPTTHLQAFSLMERGKLIARQVKAIVAGIPDQVAQRELQRVAEKLKWPSDCLESCTLPADQGPGNVLLLQLRYEQITETVISIGERRLPAETVADKAIEMIKHYQSTEVPVGEYLADQLLIPLALAGKGEFLTVEPSSHTLTNIEVIKLFLPTSITITKEGKGWKIRL